MTNVFFFRFYFRWKCGYFKTQISQKIQKPKHLAEKNKNSNIWRKKTKKRKTLFVRSSAGAYWTRAKFQGLSQKRHGHWIWRDWGFMLEPVLLSGAHPINCSGTPWLAQLVLVRGWCPFNVHVHIHVHNNIMLVWYLEARTTVVFYFLSFLYLVLVRVYDTSGTITDGDGNRLQVPRTWIPCCVLEFCMPHPYVAFQWILTPARTSNQIIRRYVYTSVRTSTYFFGFMLSCIPGIYWAVYISYLICSRYFLPE